MRFFEYGLGMNNCMAINHAKILQNRCNSFPSRLYFHIVFQLPDFDQMLVVFYYSGCQILWI